MFTDLVGYTALTQDDESLALAVLQEHAELLRPIFVKHGGREVKMIGDSFLVEFSSALSATLCAIDIQRRLYEHNVSGKTGKMALRIGVHVGDVVFRGADVLGDAVNVASRIEPLASPGSVCISQQVYDQVWNKIDNPIAGLGKRELKNVQIPMQVYRIVLPWEEATEGQTKRVLPIVDRTRELGKLELMLEKAIQGEGGLAFVAGEAGVGKTRLAEELSALSKQKHVTTLMGRCARREGKIPYAPWIEQIREFVRGSPPQMLYKVVGNYASDVAKLVPEVTAVLGPVNSVSAGSADQDRLRFIDGVTQLIVNISREAPVLLVMDDMNWADSGSLNLLSSVARRTKNSKILILGIYRDVEVEEDSDLFEFLYEMKREKLGDLVALKGFDAEDTGKMMAEILNQDDVDSEFRDLVFGKTGGNPFFIEEVLRSLVEQGVVFRTAKGWERKPISEIEIPSGVRTVIKQRLSNLDPESQNVLSVASVTSSESKEFSFALLQMVTGIDENHLVDIMERTLKARLIKETRLAAGQPGFSFTDARIRDAIYEEMTLLRRGRYHLKAAQAVEEIYKDRIEDVYGVLAYHYLKGNNPKKCLEFSIKAAHRASAVYAHGEAIKYLKIALDVLEESPDKALKTTVLEELGDSSWFAGRPDYQKYSEEAAKLCVENNEKRRAAHIYRELAEEMFDSNRENHTVPNEYYARASKLLEEEGQSEEQARLYHSLARFYILTGRLPEGDELAKKALALAEKLGVPEVEAHALLTLAIIVPPSEKDVKFQSMKKALQIGLDHNFPDVVVRAYNNLSVDSEMPAEALKYASDGLAYFQRLGYFHQEQYFKLVIASAYINLGEGEKAKILGNEVLHSNPSPLLRREALSLLGWSNLMQGKFEESEKHLLQSLVEASQDFQYVLVSYWYLGMLYTEKGDITRAEESLNRALAMIHDKELESKVTYASVVATILLYLTEVATRSGRIEEAEAHVKEARHVSDLMKSEAVDAYTNMAEGKLLASKGEFKLATDSYEKAAADFRKRGLAFYLAKSLHELGIIYGEAGDKQRAREALKEAADVFEKMGGRAYTERVQKTMASAVG